MFGARVRDRISHVALAATLLSSTAFTPASAQSLTWGAAGGGGAGAWNTSTANWFDGTSATVWAQGGDAVFAGTAGAVTLGVPITAQNMTFSTSGYTIAGNTLTLGGTTATVTTNAGISATVSSAIAGSAALVKTGTGTLTISNAANSYTGGTTVSQGTLVFGGGGKGALGSGTVTLGDANTGTSNVSLLANFPNFSAGQTIPNNIVVSGSGTGTVTIGTTSFSPGSNGTLFGGTITLNRDITIVGGNTDRTSFNGKITGTGNITLTGSRITLDSAANDFVGTITVNPATILQPNASSLPATANLNILAGAALQFANNASHVINGLSGAPGAIMRIITGGRPNLTVGAANGSGNYTAVIPNVLTSFTKTGNGTQILSAANTYVAVTKISGGILSTQIFANGGVASGIGMSTSAAANLVLDGGTLQYTGTGASTDRQFTMTANGGGIDASGSGALNFTSTAAITLSGAGSRALTLTGSSTAANTLAATLGDNGGASSLNKTGAGSWVLTANSSYTGETFIHDGTLALSGAGAIESSARVVADGTFDISGVTPASSSIKRLAGSGSVLLGSKSLAVIAANDTFSGVISGSGELTSTGGLQTLTGTNVYTGNTTISAGILQLGDGGGTGSIIGDVVNSGTLIFNRADTYTFNGLISGGGAVNQIGSGTTILTADSTYAGGTTISAGTLQLGGGGASGSIAGNITDNGALAFDRSDIYTFGGLISGSGAVSQIGGGTTILTANNSYTGGTTISAGALQLGDGGADGGIAGDVTNNAVLIFNRSNALGFGGRISGTGSVSQTGTGTTTLTGVNSYAGGTTISAGTLRGSATSFGPGAILDNAALVIDQPADGSFANAINGTGSFTKTGAGRLNYTGTGTLSGATTVAAGTLAVNGSLASSAVTVQNGGTLGGNGTVGATGIQSGGTIAPGNSIGTLHISGAFVQNTGSVYQVEVDPNTNASDLIAVNGSATLQSGAGLNVTKSVPGDYRVGTIYTVLTSTGGRTGTYTLSGQTAGVSAFLGLKDSYDANNAYLTVIQTADPVQVAETANQQQVAQNLPDPIMTPILNLPSIPAAVSAFDQLSGQIQASAKSALVAHALYVRDATFDRLRDSYCDEGRRERPRPGCSWDGPSLWGQGYGGWGGVAGNGNATGLNHATAGFLLGVDVPVAGWRAGAFGGRSRSDLQLVRMDAAAESTEYHLGAYAGTRWDEISLRLGASYSWDSITANRTVAFGTFRDQLRSVYNAGAAQGFAELGYRVAMSETLFEPFANLAYVNVRTDGFREVGGPAALTVRADTVENLISTLGVRPTSEVIVDGAELTLRGLVGWRHTFGSVAPGTTAAFAGGGDFTITGAPVARDAMALEAGMDFTVRDNVSAGLTYGSQLSSRTTDQTVRGTIRISF